MKKSVLLSLLGLFAAGQLLAQSGYVFDAERWARLKTSGGTARYMALGGAGVSLGGDIGSAQSNPAGLGFCRKSQFVFSPDFGYHSTDATYLGDAQTDSKGSFGFDNIGVIFCGIKPDLSEDDWKGGSFAVNLTRVNNFHNRFSFTGVNSSSSMLDFFRDYNYGYDPNFFYDENGETYDLHGMMYESFLIDYDSTATANDPNGNIVYKTYLNDDAVQQKDLITTRGRQWQMDFAYGANYKDKIYLGAAVGFTNLRYEQDRTYSETVGFMFNEKFQESADTIQSFKVNDYLKVNGSGVNLKVGLIAKASEAFRFGFNIQTPTYYYSMKDTYKTSLSAYFDGTTMNIPGGQVTLLSYDKSTPEGEFRYTYTAPARVSAGVSIFADKAGFVSGEIEYVPYNMATYASSNLDDRSFFNDVNQEIRNTLQGAFNYKAGAEVRLAEVKFRGGINVISDPYKVERVNKKHLYQFSAGFGFKLGTVSLDFAAVHSRNSGTYAPYGGASESVLRSKNTNVVVTAGFFFD